MYGAGGTGPKLPVLGKNTGLPRIYFRSPLCRGDLFRNFRSRNGFQPIGVAVGHNADKKHNCDKAQECNQCGR